MAHQNQKATKKQQFVRIGALVVAGIMALTVVLAVVIR